MRRHWLMWMLCWLLAAAMIVPAAAEGENMSGTTMYVVNCNDWVSLRSSPSKNAARMAQVPLGAAVQNCESASSTFTHCTYNGMSGYVLTEYLSVHAPTAGGSDSYIGEMRVVNCNDWVSLRSGPSTSASRITTVPLGAVLMECTRYSAKFVYGNYNGQWGYVLSDYLSRVPDQVVEGQGYVGDMTVVNCNDWVSLREEPSTSASRIVKVPLGATVQNCTWYSANFICCDYNGMTGYILSEYLQPADGFAATIPVGGVPARENRGKQILQYPVGGLTVYAYHDFGSSSESLYVECLDAQGAQVWEYATTVPFTTELQCADAFIGGTAEKPLVIVFNASEGLYALDFHTGERQWQVPNATVSFGGSISYAVDAAGTAYIGGYYGPDPVAVDVNGQVLWQAVPGYDAYWMSQIEVTESGIVTTYDCIDEHEAAGQITYGFDGAVLDVVWF